MVVPQKPVLSLGEKGRVIFKLLALLPVRLFSASAIFTLKSLRHGLPVRMYLIAAYIKVALFTLPGRQLQFVGPSTREQAQVWLKQRAKKAKPGEVAPVHEVQGLKNGHAAILWIGDRTKATKVVLFFHGGGYVSPAAPAHFEWCYNSYVLGGKEAGVDVAVAFLQYTLAPNGQYPQQLREATEALTELFNAGYQPKDIIVGGDSAGGNLTMQLLSHILHAHPDVEPVKLEHPLSAAFLVSPWISTSTTGPSFSANNSNDMITSGVIDRLGPQAMGVAGWEEAKAGKHPWATPVDAEESWLAGLENATKAVYITVGNREVLADQGVKLAERVRRLDEDIDVRLDAADKHAHDWVLIEAWVGQFGDATARMKDWFKGIVAGK